MFGFVEILLLIGAFHGFFLGSILAFKQNGDHAANRLFAALLLITSWQLFLTALSKSGVLVQVPHLAGTAIPFMFLVGPLYYFYAKKLTHGAFGFKVYDVLHLIPFLYVVWSFLPYYLTDHAIKAEALAAQHLTQPSLSASMLLYVLGNLLLAVSYFFAAHRLIARKVQSFKDMASDNAALSSLSRLRRLTQGYALYLLGLALTITLLFFFDAYNDAIDTAWVLTKSLFIHAIGYVAIVQPVYFWAAMPGQPFHAPVASEVPPEKEQREEDKYQKSGLADEQAASYHDQLLHLMEEHTPYLDSDLTLHQLATFMSISPNQLSQVINQQAGMNFYDFVNQYRVEHAKRLLLDETVDYTMIDSDDLSGPVGLAVDEADNLYVTSQNTKKILQYNPDGTVQTLVEVTDIGDANIGWLAYLDGALYTTVWANNVIYKIGLDGTAEQFAGTGMDSSIDGDLNTASFSGPNGIGASQHDNALFVSDSRTGMLRKITLDASSVGVQDEAELPSRYDLLKPNYPNPFSTSTTISYTVPETAHVYIGIYNMQGQRVRILVDAMRGPGDHMVVWNTNDTHEGSFSE